MGRPVGSKNKEKLGEVLQEGVVPIAEPVKKEFCSCGHDNEMHYGTLNRHCNTKNCECNAYKKQI